jgi:hypothetical protein
VAVAVVVIPTAQPVAVHCAFCCGTLTVQAGLSGSKFGMVNCCGAACATPQNPANASDKRHRTVLISAFSWYVAFRPGKRGIAGAIREKFFGQYSNRVRIGHAARIEAIERVRIKVIDGARQIQRGGSAPKTGTAVIYSTVLIGRHRHPCQHISIALHESPSGHIILCVKHPNILIFFRTSSHYIVTIIRINDCFVFLI